MRQAATATLLFAAGCGAPAPPPTPTPPAVRLSTQDTGANVAPVVALFRRTCLDAANDNHGFAAAVAASGWPLRQVHSQDEEGPSLWRFDHGELMQWKIRQATGCFLSLQSTVPPAPAALRVALQPLVQRPGVTPVARQQGQYGWSWPADPGYRMVLTINVIPPSPGRTYGAGRQAVSLGLVGERVPAAGQEQE